MSAGDKPYAKKFHVRKALGKIIVVLISLAFLGSMGYRFIAQIAGK